MISEIEVILVLVQNPDNRFQFENKTKREVKLHKGFDGKENIFLRSALGSTRSVEIYSGGSWRSLVLNHRFIVVYSQFIFNCCAWQKSYKK